MKLAKALIVLLTVATLLPAMASAECMINGNISVEDSNSPLGAYMYTLDITWDMGSQHGLSHLDLVVDMAGGTCSCEDFASYISFDTISGTSDGEDGCTVEYYSELACNGDPSIDLDGILFKFEPIEGDCEPGPTGSGSFVFYSDLPGVPVNDQILALADKAAQEYCSGTLTGVFPGMACDPVANEDLSLDSIKGLYR
jgi:hypothetical protein